MAHWKNKDEIKERVLHFADKIDVKAKHISIRPMRNKWASCSTKGNLSFNEELLDMDKALGDYVIVHELLHFRAPNHGKLWKALMMAYLGDYEKIEKRLKSRATTIDKKEKVKG